MPPTILASKVSKYYQLPLRQRRSGKSRLSYSDRFDSRRGFAALKNVSFQATPGSSLAVVGQNGAGKTTLLRILAGVTRPSAGRVSIEGRVSSLLGLQAGMNPRLTGRDNLFLYGTLMGFERAEITAKLPEIIAFSELGSFLEQPLASYSPGMVSRLAFATAVHLDTDVLLLDEVLAVGDPSFQARALRRMRRYFQGGSTVVFCSHNLDAIESLCTDVLWLDNGRVEALGAAAEVLDDYRLFCGRRKLSAHPVKSLSAPQQNVSARLSTSDELGNERNRFATDEAVVIRLDYGSGFNFAKENIRLTLFDPVAGGPAFEVDASAAADSIPERGAFTCTVEPGVLKPRQYWAELSSGSELELRAPLLIFDPREASGRDSVSPDPAKVRLEFVGSPADPD